MSDPILIEDEDGLNVVTTLDEARDQIRLLRADNGHLRKTTDDQREELHGLYEVLYGLRGLFNEAIDNIFQLRRTR